MQAQQAQVQAQQRQYQPPRSATLERPTYDRPAPSPGIRLDPSGMTQETTSLDYSDTESSGPTPSGIKSNGPSSKDLASRMEEQRKEWEESMNPQNQAFI